MIKKKSNENQKKVVLKEIDRKYIKSHYCNSKQNEIFVMVHLKRKKAIEFALAKRNIPERRKTAKTEVCS